MKGKQKIPTIHAGLTITDKVKQQWKITQCLGAGGHGDVYAVEAVDGKRHGEVAVAKVEWRIPKMPQALDMERAFYLSVGKPSNINSFKGYVGIPRYIMFGEHEISGFTFFFLILERLKHDLSSLIASREEPLDLVTINCLASQLITTLRYIHSHGMAYCDIKNSNIMTRTNDQNRVCLVDFGISESFRINNVHVKRERIPNNFTGSPDYACIDAHEGCYVSRRGDLESLGYLLLAWASGSRLPWSDPLMVAAANPSVAAVKAHTEKAYKFKLIYKNDAAGLVRKTLGSENGSCAGKSIKALLEHAYSIGYDQEPNYDAMEKLFFKSGPSNLSWRTIPKNVVTKSGKVAIAIKSKNVKEIGKTDSKQEVDKSEKAKPPPSKPKFTNIKEFKKQYSVTQESTTHKITVTPEITERGKLRKLRRVDYTE